MIFDIVAALVIFFVVIFFVVIPVIWEFVFDLLGGLVGLLFR